jgi:hypothetical protein
MKTKEEISSAYSKLWGDVGDYLIDALKDTSDEDPMEVHIALEFNAMGLSTLEMPTITQIFKDSDDIIWVKYYNSDTFIELSFLCFDYVIQIVRDL